MEYTIKPEFVGKTVKIYDRFKGTKTIIVDQLDLSKVKYYQTIGLKHVFEEVVTTTAPESTVIEYKGIVGPISESDLSPEFLKAIDTPVKKKRTKKFVERLEEVKQEQDSNNAED
jgi:hypothetical protein